MTPKAPFRAPRVAAIILAAGISRRMGFPKPFLEFGGVRFIDRVTSAIDGSGAAPIVIVANADHARRWETAPPPPAGQVIYNHHSSSGMLNSIRIGLRHLLEQGVEVSHAMVCLSDMPHVQPDTYRAVLLAAIERPGRIVIAARGDHRGHPVAFPRELFDRLINDDLPDGARSIVTQYADRVDLLDVDDQAVIEDIDTPSDFERITGIRPTIPTDD